MITLRLKWGMTGMHFFKFAHKNQLFFKIDIVYVVKDVMSVVMDYIDIACYLYSVPFMQHIF